VHLLLRPRGRKKYDDKKFKYIYNKIILCILCVCANTRIYFVQEWKTTSSTDRMRKKNISVSGALNILQRSFSANFLPIRVCVRKISDVYIIHQSAYYIVRTLRARQMAPLLAWRTCAYIVNPSDSPCSFRSGLTTKNDFSQSVPIGGLPTHTRVRALCYRGKLWA